MADLPGMSSSRRGKSGKRSKPGQVPSHMKYPKYSDAPAELGMSKPSERVATLKASAASPSAAPQRRPAPEIVEFLDIEHYSLQRDCAVPVDEPLFQPFPSEMVYRNYEPFASYTQILFCRNNDAFARRIKIVPPDSPFFAVSPPTMGNKPLPPDGKVAAGMEIRFVVTFTPREKREYSHDLVCVTEREKFIIPIRALGTQACLAFPDEIDLGLSAVKNAATKTVLVRNVGDRATTFLLSTQAPFAASPAEGHVEAGATFQATVTFTPDEARDYASTLVVQCGGGGGTAEEWMQVALRGSAENVNVHLSTHVLQLDPAYITLSTQSTLKLHNRSDVPVRFSWNSFSCANEETNERDRLHGELGRMEDVELENTSTRDFQGGGYGRGAGGGGGGGGDDPSSSDDEDDGMPAERQVELALLSRKYKHLRHAIDDDPMRFTDENFTVHPLVGQVWPGSELEFTVTFAPNTAADYSCMGFLEVTGREARLPMKLQATGIGPKAAFSFDVLDIGDVFVNSVHKYELVLENHGDIPAEYALQQAKTPFGPQFVFSPESGCLGVGEKHTMEVTFSSGILGEFSERFVFAMKGSTETLSVHFKGHVVGPTFHFDVDLIDFKTVSYEFMNSRTFNLFNTSDIPMKFKLRVPMDGKFLNKEFDILPAGGTVLPHGSQQIQLDFISTTVRVYEMFLTVDVEGVGEGLLSIPIRAECKLPDVSLVAEEIVYGDCFMRYPYRRSIRMVNAGEQRARFEVTPQDERSQAVGSHSPDQPRGTIEANSFVDLNIDLVCEKLGNINLPVYVRVAGVDGAPLVFTLSANAVGPNVVLAQPSLDWGSIPCLTPTDLELTITNDSLVPAAFKTVLNNTRSKWKVNVREALLAPQESTTLILTADLDDTTKHQDQLHVIVTEGENIIVPLLARGIGSTIYCEEAMDTIDFGHQFTSLTCSKRFLLENRGRRPQLLTWVNETKRKNESEQRSRIARLKKDHERQVRENPKKAKKAPKDLEVEPVVPVFTVAPDTIELRPRTACWFTFNGETSTMGHVSEVLVLESKVGKEKNARKVLSCTTTADFINPLLESSSPGLEFSYTFEPNVPVAVQRQPFTLRNISALTLQFALRVAPPFSVDVAELQLEPQETATVTVTFDPGYRDDRTSHFAEAKLVAVYRDHPQRDAFNMTGDINFPNLEFEYTEVDFGCVLNDTTKAMRVTMTNVSKIDTRSCWLFECDEAGMQSAATARKPYIPINQVFDVLPIRSLLRPGESETVEFLYYGHAHRRFGASAICDVEGGPDYPLSLTGEASTVVQRLDRHFLDFGRLPYDEGGEQEFHIVNSGKVAFDFRIRTDQCSRQDVVLVHPMKGKVYANDKQRIVVKFRPGIPEQIMESIVVELAHYEPIMFPVYGQGIYASVNVTLPRVDAESSDWLDLMAEARGALQKVGANTGALGLPTGVSPRSMGIELGMAPPPPLAITAGGETKGERPAPIDGEDGVGETKAGAAAMSAAANVASGVGLAAGQSAAVPQTSEGASAMSMFSATGDVKDIDIEKEADRLAYSRFLLVGLGGSAQTADAPSTDAAAAAGEDGDVADRPLVPPLAIGDSAPGGDGATGAQGSGAGQTKKAAAGADGAGGADGFVLAMHVADFGNVVAGHTRKKAFRVTNTGSLPVSFELDKVLAQHHGFSIDPVKVKFLPEGESVNFKVVFQARKDQLGPVEVNLPMAIRDGPPRVVQLSANVTVPDLQITPDNIDFGEVMVGHEHIVYAQLLNTAPVPTTWQCGQGAAAAGRGNRDVDDFACTPNEGTLQPGEAVNVAIAYTPQEERTYNYTVPIKIQSNGKQRHIRCRGAGLERRCVFDPPAAELPPTLPFEAAERKIVLLRNHTARAIEVYSLDFDEKYLEEEAIVRSVDLWNQPQQGSDAGVPYSILRFPPRAAGDPLPEAILASEQFRLDAIAEAEAAAQALAEAEALAAAAAAAAAEAAAEAPDEPAADNADEAKDEAKDEAAEESVDAVGAIEMPNTAEAPVAPTRRQRGFAMDILVHGPALIGCSTQAKELSGVFTLPVITLDEAVDWCIKHETGGGAQCKEQLDAVDEAEEDADKKGKGDKKKKGKGKAEEVVTDDADAGADAAAKLPPGKLSQAQLVAALRDRVAWVDCANGVIFDGIKSTYALSEEAVGMAIREALDPESVREEAVVREKLGFPRNVLRVVLMGTAAVTYADHLAAIRTVLQNSSADAVALEDEEVNAMDSEALAAYNTLQGAAAFEAKAAGAGSDEEVDALKPEVPEVMDDEALEGLSAEDLAAHEAKQMDVEAWELFTQRRQYRAMLTRMDAVLATASFVAEEEEVIANMDDGARDAYEQRVFEVLADDAIVALAPEDRVAYDRKRALALHRVFLGACVDVVNHFDGSSGVVLGAAGTAAPFADDGSEHGVSAAPSDGETKDEDSGGMVSPVDSDAPLSLDGSQEGVPMSGGRKVDVYTPPSQVVALEHASGQGVREVAISICKVLPDVPDPSAYVTPRVQPVPKPVLNMLVRKPVLRMARNAVMNFKLVTIGRMMELDVALAMMEKAEASGLAVTEASMAIQLMSEEEREMRGEEATAALEALQEEASSASFPPRTEAFEPLSDEEHEALSGEALAAYDSRHEAWDKWRERPSETRWVLPPNSCVVLAVDFLSQSVGRFDRTLGFEIVGSDTQYVLPCSAVCEVPRVNQDARNVFMNRLKAPRAVDKVHKKFVISRSRYEFGPLLIGKDRETALAAAGLEGPAEEGGVLELTAAEVQTLGNAEQFRISNNGLFPAHVDFAFMHGDGAQPSPFVVEPTSLDLDVQETKSITLWAFPAEAKSDEAKSYEDILVCSVKDNPEVVQFPVSCLGASPGVELHGPWEVRAELEVKEGEDGVAAETSDDAPVEPTIDFGRLLLRRREEKEFTLQSVCAIPVVWRVKLTEEFEQLGEFQVSSMGGVLEPYGSVVVGVSFSALKEEMFDHTIVVEFSDAEVGFGDVDGADEAGEEKSKGKGDKKAAVAGGEPNIVQLPIIVRAEAYDIKYTVPEFSSAEDGDAAATEDAAAAEDDKGGSLDYGSLRVGEESTKEFTLRNKGKYDIKFSFALRKKVARDLFTIEPMEGVLSPAGGGDSEAQVITIRFNSTQEVGLRDNKDIRCNIMEATSGEFFESFDVTVSVRSVFSMFRLQPLRGINFGANMYGANPSRRIEIRNDGHFDSFFQVVLVREEEEAERALAAQRLEAEEKGEEFAMPVGGDGLLTDGLSAVKHGHGDDKFHPKVPEGEKAMGPFIVTPQGGRVAPNETVVIEVGFQAEGASLFREPIRIDVSGRDPSDKVGQVYELMGESCIPGINTEDFESIFEEQAVVRRIEPTADDENMTGIASGGVFAEEQRMFNFGSIVPSSCGPRGVVERFKISNPNKIKALVDFNLQGDDEQSLAAFSVQPASVDIPSHEHRYISVYFKPSAMRSYTANFEATVQDGTEPRTNKLKLEVAGIGTMPCITVEKPTVLTADGHVLVDFGDLQAKKIKTLPLALRNNGAVPATVCFDMPGHDSFAFDQRGHSLTLKPKQSRTLDLTFCPKVASEEPLDCNLRLSVLHNEYEATVVKLTGKAFLNDMSLEGLPSGSADELIFGDLDLLNTVKVVADGADGADGSEERKDEHSNAQNSIQVPFSVQSQCDESVRFAFGEHADFVFSPSIGHLPPRGSKEIVATFRPAAESLPGADQQEDPDAWRIAHEKLEVGLRIQRITFTPAEGEEANVVLDWDNRPTGVRYVDGENGTTEKVEDVMTEPVFEGAGDEVALPLLCSATADRVRYSVDSRQIVFHPTMMFQTRVFQYPVVNTGATKLSYKWEMGTTTQAMPRAGMPCPFTVSPETGEIAPGETQSFSVRFSPMEVPTAPSGRYETSAVCMINNLPTGMEPLAVTVRGVAQRPVCHFDLPPSDYLDRRPPDMAGPSGNLGPLDPNIRVLSFDSLGTRVKNTCRFKLVNPMNVGYEFQWEPVGTPHPAFRCVNMNGLVLPGRRYEMVFEYSPDMQDAEGSQESFWQFNIPQHNITQMFLVAGRVLEPNVSMDKTHMNFSSVLLGATARETVRLVNREYLPFSFNFDRSALQAPGDTSKPQLRVEPSSGVVPANSELPIEVVFSPTDEKSHNINLVCNVKRKPNKLSLNVKGEGSAVHDRLTLTDTGADGSTTEVDLSSDALNYVDFGHVHVNDCAVKRVVVSNSGKFNIDFNWSKAANPQFIVEPAKGLVKRGEYTVCTVSFRPVAECLVESLHLSCVVAGSRHYRLSVAGQGARPALNFSFLQHDFGPCFTPARGAAPIATEMILRISNNDMDEDIAIDCLYEKTQHLAVDFKPTVLRPNDAVEVPLRFMPRDMKSYKEMIPFEVNGLSTINVLVAGEGTACKLELANPSDQLVNFGTLRVGQEVSRRVRLINRSKREAEFELLDPLEAGQGRLEERAVSFFPARGTILQPREAINLELRFSPGARIGPFTEELMIRTPGGERPLVTMTGSCQGIEVVLETDSLPFGTVCEHCKITRMLQLENIGDLGTKFRWDASAFGPDFSISPAEGYLAPHSDVKLEVSFHPSYIYDDFRRERLACMVEGHHPLFLTLSGVCEAQPDGNVHEITFDAAVREETSQSVSIENPTSKVWHLQPAIANDYWRGRELVFEVPAKGKADYEIMYRPLSMTAGAGDAEADGAEGGQQPPRPAQHEGTAFFPLPTGQGVMYKLVGTASAPLLAGTITETVAAKKALVISLPVANWLKKAQRFSTNMERDAEFTPASHDVTGADCIDVPALGTRDFKLNFYGYKEGTSKLTVMFVSERTGEYVQYNVEVNVTEPGKAGQVWLETPVRQPVQELVTIENPLPADQVVHFADGDEWWTCEDPCVTVKRLVDMSGQGQGTFEVEFRPLVADTAEILEAGGRDVNLTISCAELGDYHYTLHLRATPAATERAIHFKTALGNGESQTFRFTNFVTGAAQVPYTCTVQESSFFQVENTVSVAGADTWEGSEGSVVVRFEPDAIGEVRDVLRVKSEQGGEYVCALVGHGVPPQPQGPLVVAAGGQGTAEFKNVFADAREFTFTVDNPAFAVGSQSAKIDAKKVASIVVKFTTPADAKEGAVITGKLWISCPEAPDSPPWIWYLQGQC